MLQKLKQNYNLADLKFLKVFHRHLAIESDDPTLPKEAKYAENGQKFKAAEMVDFNSLYVSLNLNLVKLPNICVFLTLIIKYKLHLAVRLQTRIAGRTRNRLRKTR